MMTPRDKLVVASENVTFEEAKTILDKHRLEKLPLVNSEDHLKGLITSTGMLLIKDRER